MIFVTKKYDSMINERVSNRKYIIKFCGGSKLKYKFKEEKKNDVKFSLKKRLFVYVVNGCWKRY